MSIILGICASLSDNITFDIDFVAYKGLGTTVDLVISPEPIIPATCSTLC